MEAHEIWALLRGLHLQGTVFGLGPLPMDQMVWKAWAPPKVKFFAWLALQDRIWTAADWRSEDGLTVALAPCADGCRNVALIFSSDAASLSGFETWLFRNFASTTWTRPHDTCSTPFRPDGRAHASRHHRQKNKGIGYHDSVMGHLK